MLHNLYVIIILFLRSLRHTYILLTLTYRYVKTPSLKLPYFAYFGNGVSFKV